MTDVAMQDAELLEWLLEHHAALHRQMSRETRFKKFARNRTPEMVERAHAYVARPPVESAEAEYRAIMRHPAAWADARERIAHDIAVPPNPQAHALCFEHHDRCVADPVGEARTAFDYLRMRASIPGAYGRPGGADPIAARRWAELSAMVQEEPVLPVPEQELVPGPR